MAKFLFPAILLGSFLLMGCGPEDVGQTNSKPPTKEDVERQIKEIEDNPNMPPQAKAIAIEQAKRNLPDQGGSGAKFGGN